MTRSALAATLLLVAPAACRRAELLPPPALAVLPGTVGPGVGVPYPSGVRVSAGVRVPAGALTPETVAGTYVGQSQLIRNAGRCGRGGNARLVVREPVVRWRVDRDVPEIAAAIALDGALAADDGATVMRGQFTPGRVDFDAGTALCGYRYTLVKR